MSKQIMGEIEKYTPVDGIFYLISHPSKKDLFAKAYTIEDARLIAAAEAMKDMLIKLSDHVDIICTQDEREIHKLLAEVFGLTIEETKDKIKGILNNENNA